MTTVHSLATELDVMAAVSDGLSLINNGALVLECPVNRGRSNAKRFGAAQYRRHRDGSVSPIQIVLHPTLFKPELREKLISTFLHEVAHQIAELFWAELTIHSWAQHGQAWRRVMRRMGQVPSRCASIQDSIQLTAHSPARAGSAFTNSDIAKLTQQLENS